MARTRLASWLGLVAAFALVAACSGDGGGTSTTGGSEPATTVAGGEEPPADIGARTITVALPGVPEMIHSDTFQGDTMRWLEGALTTGLVSWNATPITDGCETLPVASSESVRPALAESLEVSEDGRQITVTLRENMKSNFGNTLTSEDVRWTWEMRRETGYTPFRLWLTVTAGGYDIDDPITVIDDRTFTINITDPSALDQVILADWATAPLDSTEAKKHVTADDPWALQWLANNSATFGPWYVSEENFDPGNEAILLRNPHWWDNADWAAKGNIERIIWRSVPDAATRMTLMLAGEVDHIMNQSHEQISVLQESEGVDVFHCAGPATSMLLMNHASEGLSDARVRRAISMAIDRDAIIQAAYPGGLANPARHGVISTNLPNLPSDLAAFEYDPDQARALLEEAGFGDGLTIDLLWSPARGAAFDAIAIQLQDQLAQVGVTLQLSPVPTIPEWRERWADREFDMTLDVLFGMFADAYVYAGAYFLSTSPNNHQSFASEEFDELILTLRVTPPGPERDELLRQVAEFWMEEMPSVQIADENIAMIFSDRLDAETAYLHYPHTNVFFEELSIRD